jgi:uncharacterized protein (TIGR02996 family)
MATEQSFLDAIKSQPEDGAVWLVYADWLEERGDPRGELIRIEEEMRSLPAYSDRYWGLKPRRNALRQGCDKEWLQRLKYGTDYEPVFCEVPDGWKERWRLLREFTERWYRIPMTDVGGRAAEVQETERRLNLELPPAFKEWIAYCHDLNEQDSFDILRDCYEVVNLEDLSAVSLLIQGGQDVYWAVKKETLHHPDPPVESYVLDYEGDDEDRFVHDCLLAQRLTSFALGHLISYCTGAGGGAGRSVEPSAELLGQLAEAFPVQVQSDGYRVFERTNIIAMLRGGFLDVTLWKKLGQSEMPEFIWRFLGR